MPLYICLESSPIISPFTFLAISIAKLDLPLAVGPNRAKEELMDNKNFL